MALRVDQVAWSRPLPHLGNGDVSLVLRNTLVTLPSSP